MTDVKALREAAGNIAKEVLATADDNAPARYVPGEADAPSWGRGYNTGWDRALVTVRPLIVEALLATAKSHSQTDRLAELEAEVARLTDKVDALAVTRLNEQRRADNAEAEVARVTKERDEAREIVGVALPRLHQLAAELDAPALPRLPDEDFRREAVRFGNLARSCKPAEERADTLAAQVKGLVEAERDWLKKQVFALCEGTTEAYHKIGQQDLEGKEGASGASDRVG